ncbi:hypothetical protein CR513_28652, partial [Mucuna pruriens]
MAYGLPLSGDGGEKPQGRDLELARKHIASCILEIDYIRKYSGFLRANAHGMSEQSGDNTTIPGCQPMGFDASLNCRLSTPIPPLAIKSIAAGAAAIALERSGGGPRRRRRSVVDRSRGSCGGAERPRQCQIATVLFSQGEKSKMPLLFKTFLLSSPPPSCVFSSVTGDVFRSASFSDDVFRLLLRRRFPATYSGHIPVTSLLNFSAQFSGEILRIAAIPLSQFRGRPLRSAIRD